jgi:hypothetical protein
MVWKTVGDGAGDEQHAARLNRVVAAGHLQVGPAGQDQVDLVLLVGLLGVVGPGLEHVQPAAHRVTTQELEVQLAGAALHLGPRLLQGRDVEGLGRGLVHQAILTRPTGAVWLAP